jgi:hypothetical protein
MKYAVFQCVIVEADSQEDAAKAACNPLLRESLNHLTEIKMVMPTDYHDKRCYRQRTPYDRRSDWNPPSTVGLWLAVLSVIVISGAGIQWVCR